MLKIRRIINSVNIKKFLTKYKIEFKEANDNLIMRCPFHKDKSPSFSMALKGKTKGRFICYASNCGVTGDFINFVCLMEEIDRVEAIEYLEEEISLKKTYNLKRIKSRLKSAKKNFQDEIDSDVKKKKTKNGKVKEHRDVMSFEDQIIELGSYLNSVRNHKDIRVIEKIIKEFKIRIVEHKWIGLSICIPIVFNNKIVSYYYESLADRGVKRYSRGSKISHTLFHLKEKDYKRVFVVEGIWDSIKLWACGFNATTCFSSKVSTIQSDFLNEYAEDVIIFFDGDDAGMKGSNAAKRLLEPTNNVYIIKTPNGKDPDDLQPKRIKSLIHRWYREKKRI